MICLLLTIPFCLHAAAEPRVLERQATSLVYPPFWHTPFGVHRGTPKLLKLFLGNRTRFSSPQGLACTRLLSDASSPSPDLEFRLSVIGANTGQGDLIYNPNLTSLEVLGDQGDTAGIFEKPMGVAMFADGTTYVTDPRAGQVVRLRFKDQRLRPDGCLPDPPGGWLSPWGVALDSGGKIYVSDTRRNQVFIFSPQGTLLKTLGPELSGKVRLSAPRALAVTDSGQEWSFYKDNYIYLCDQQGTRLLRLDLQGRVQLEFHSSSLPEAEQPAGLAWLALDYYENLWVTDSRRCQVHKFNRHLQLLTAYGTPGDGDGHFLNPTGIAIYRHFGQVFIAQEQGAHYFWIGADVLAPQIKWHEQQPNLVCLQFFLTEPAWVSISANTHRLCHKQRFDSGLQNFHWNPAPALSRKALTFTLTAEATYSSARHLVKRITLNLPPGAIVPPP
ncbi:NHL repeat-containing protein [bacterium]|nr:NHL repeat-containing protein [bacterium]